MMPAVADLVSTSRQGVTGVNTKSLFSDPNSAKANGADVDSVNNNTYWEIFCTNLNIA
jgi:hypothetical protein